MISRFHQFNILLPVPETHTVHWFLVWNAYWIPALTSSIICWSNKFLHLLNSGSINFTYMHHIIYLGIYECTRSILKIRNINVFIQLYLKLLRQPLTWLSYILILVEYLCETLTTPHICNSRQPSIHIYVRLTLYKQVMNIYVAYTLIHVN